jgi:hypothetical protein
MKHLEALRKIEDFFPNGIHPDIVTILRYVDHLKAVLATIGIELTHDSKGLYLKNDERYILTLHEPIPRSVAIRWVYWAIFDAIPHLEHFPEMPVDVPEDVIWFKGYINLL